MKKTVDNFIALDIEIKALTKKRNALRKALIDSRSPGAFVPGSNGVGVTIVSAERTILDSKAIKAERPDLWALFSKSSSSISLKISDNILKEVA